MTGIPLLTARASDRVHEDHLCGAFSAYYSTSFDGEGAITSAIDYVVNEEQPKLYLVEGHGEADLPSTFAEQVEKDNIETESLSLLHTETIPEDADCLMIYAPESNLSEDEQNLLADYVAGGGKLLVVAGPTRENGILENLYSLLSDYGVEPAEGIVVESDSNYYSAFSGPAAILPELHSNDITDSLIDANYSVLMPIALGLTVEDPYSGAVTELLTTSDTSFSKTAGYAMETYDYEDGDIDGPLPRVFLCAPATEKWCGSPRPISSRTPIMPRLPAPTATLL